MPRRKKVKYEIAAAEKAVPVAENPHASPTIKSAGVLAVPLVSPVTIAEAAPAVVMDTPPQRRGRPKGSKNKPKVMLAASLEQMPIETSSAQKLMEKIKERERGREEEWKKTGGRGVKESTEMLWEEKERAAKIKVEMPGAGIKKELAAKPLDMSELKKEKPLTAEEIMKRAAEKRQRATRETERTQQELEKYQRELKTKGVEKMAEERGQEIAEREAEAKTLAEKSAKEAQAKADREKVAWHKKKVMERRLAKPPEVQAALREQFKQQREKWLKEVQERGLPKSASELAAPKPPTPGEIAGQQIRHRTFLEQKEEEARKAEMPKIVKPELPPSAPPQKLSFWDRLKKGIAEKWYEGRPDRPKR